MPKYIGIVNYLTDKIARNEIKTEQRLPTIRELAALFHCSKVTVVRAYTELQQNHIVYAIPQDGYYLVHKNKLDNSSAVINFAAASPDENVLPYREIQHCLNQAIDKYRYALFNYAQPQGLPSLIEVMAKYLVDYQIFTKPDNLFITAGAQQAIHILSTMPYPNNKTNILVEQPTYNGILQFLATSNIPVLGIERNFQGLNLAELERTFAQNNIKLFYTCPRFHNPLGTSLSPNERKQIVKLADKYDVYIVEDDYLSDLERHSNAYSLYYEDMSSRVIYIKSFSKMLLPGLRIATVVMPPIMAECFKKYKKWMDLGTSVLSQGALEIYIKCGMIKTHRKKIQKVYKSKMQLLNEKVQAVGFPNIKWHVPEVGFFACAEFLNKVDISKLICRLKEKDIIINDIRENYLDSYYNNKILKLSVSKASLNDISEGIAAILDEIKRQG
ncbi:MAG: PLP-dependent aminotransferase family protein [Pelosinus sp.]|nr:PLP-dependent aminotransferase family protein [Pelosinus sp.]